MIVNKLVKLEFFGSAVLFVFLNCLVKVSSIIYETPQGQTKINDVPTLYVFFFFAHPFSTPKSYFY